MRDNRFDLTKYEEEYGEDVDTFQRIKRTRPEKEEELRTKGRKLNHRTKKKKDIEF